MKKTKIQKALSLLADRLDTIGMKKEADLVDRMIKTTAGSFDEFTQAYLEAALWSSTGDDGQPLDKKYSVGDIDPESLKKMQADAKKFQDEFYDDIDEDLSRAGHDFWLTRNGHGAGFWDGDWPDDVGKKLTDACKKFGEVDLYVGDDGAIHQHP